MAKKSKKVIPPIVPERWVKNTMNNVLVRSFPTKELAMAHATELNVKLGFVRFVVNHVESDWTKM